MVLYEFYFVKIDCMIYNNRNKGLDSYCILQWWLIFDIYKLCNYCLEICDNSFI